MSADTNFTEQLRVACNAPAKDYSLHPAETIMLYWAAEMVLLLAICLEDSFYWCSLQPNADTSSEALAILTVPLIHDIGAAKHSRYGGSSSRSNLPARLLNDFRPTQWFLFHSSGIEERAFTMSG